MKGDLGPDGRSRFFAPYLDANGIRAGESALIDDSPDLAPALAATGIRFLSMPTGVGPVSGFASS